MLVPFILAALVGISQQAGILLDSGLPMGILPIDMNQPQTNTQTTTYKKPWFCHDIECPRFSVMETNDKFEVRKYEPSVWVATKLTTMLFNDEARRGMFFKLFHYITGNNTSNMKIAMTAPVVNVIEHGAGPDCESNFTMHFMVPFALQNNPPQPTMDGVFIVRKPEMTVIVKSYSEYSSEDIKRQKLTEFVGDLNASGKQFYDNVFSTAGYDGPYAFADRHNELWVFPK